jgi:hypothetical protein
MRLSLFGPVVSIAIERKEKRRRSRARGLNPPLPDRVSNPNQKEKPLMRKIGIIAVLSLMMMALAAVPALAANPHFLRGPTFTDNGTTVTTTGTIAGLGNQDVTVQVLASGTGTVTCRNPAGKVAPGQDQEINTSGTQTGIEVKNGKATFSVTTLPPAQPTDATDAGCPNDKWRARITDVDFTSATINVYQGGMLVFTQTRAI